MTYMLSLISSFSVDIGRYVQGARSAERLVHENKKAYGVFDKAIRMTAPKFKPYISAHYDLAEDRCFSSSDNEDEDHEDDEEDSDEYSDDGSSQTFDLSDMRQHIEKYVQFPLNWRPLALGHQADVFVSGQLRENSPTTYHLAQQ